MLGRREFTPRDRAADRPLAHTEHRCHLAGGNGPIVRCSGHAGVRRGVRGPLRSLIAHGSGSIRDDSFYGKTVAFPTLCERKRMPNERLAILRWVRL